MMDYLELIGGAAVDALLESERKLDDALARMRRPAAEEMEPDALNGDERPGGQTAVPAPSRGMWIEDPLEAENWDWTPLTKATMPAPVGQKAPAPLLEAVARLERLGAAWTGNDGAAEPRNSRTNGLNGPVDRQREPVGAASAEESDGERTTGSAGRRTAWTENAVRAEEIDRAFRRDSRRYDGGFFLY